MERPLDPRAPIRALRDAAWHPGWSRISRVFDPIADLATPLGALPDWPDLEALSAWVATAAAPEWSPTFVPQRRPRRGRASPERQRGPREPQGAAGGYDQRIVELGEVPTRRRHGHDLMNALVWAAFPRAKRAIHARQHEEHGSGWQRSAGAPALDSLAMLDEGGVVLLGTAEALDPLEAPLRVSDRGPVARALDEGRCALWIFGHGILESVLLRGTLVRTEAITVTVRCEALPEEPTARRALADARLATLLGEEHPAFLDRPRPSVELDEGWLGDRAAAR